VEGKIPFGHLEIHQAQIEEVYRDIVRVPESDRVDSHGQPIEEGRICKIKTGSKETYVIVRGVKNFVLERNPAHVHSQCIHMDDVTRKLLGISNTRSARFEITPVGSWGQLKWAWSATEISYRIASRLAVVGLALGLIALIVSLPETLKLAQTVIQWIHQHIRASAD